MILLLLLSSALCHAQATVTFKNLSSAVIKPVTGRHSRLAQVTGNTGFSVWQTEVCSEQATPLTIPRERLMAAVPAIHELPNDIAQEVLNRRAAASAPSVALRIIDGTLPIVSTAGVAYGLSKKQNYATISGLSLMAVMLIRAEVARGAPNPQTILGDLLPATVSLVAAQCGTWLIVAGMAPSVETIGPIRIVVP